MKPLRLAVWGLGGHAVGKILPAVAAADGLALAGVCSRNAGAVAECSAAWRCIGWTDPKAMLRDDRVDIVYVATPIALHAEHGRHVLEAGKHLWCEKPLTTSRDRTMELMALSRAQGRAVFEGHMYLHHPQFRQLRSYVAGGRLGTIASIACRFGIPRLERPGFRTDPALGGGALLDVGCYPVSALQALFPDDRERVLSARSFTRDGWGLDTDGDALIELSGGAVAHLEWRINSSYRADIDVWGDKGSVFTEKMFSKPATYVPVLHLRDVKGTETTERTDAADHFVLMLRDFRIMIDDGMAVESQRCSITRRADVLEQIRSVSASTAKD